MSHVIAHIAINNMATITSCECVSSGGLKGKKPRATQPLIGSEDVESDDVTVPG